MSSQFKRAFMDDDMLDPEHLRDQIEIVHKQRGEYDPKTGEYGPDQEIVTWTGRGSIQPYIKESFSGSQPPTGGIDLAVNAFRIFLPYEALKPKETGFTIRSGNRYFQPKFPPMDPAGQHEYWIVLAVEVSRQ